MNADILKRVVRAIADGSQNDLDRLADKIIESERRTGHVKLAGQLEAILKQPRPKRPTAQRPTHWNSRSGRYGSKHPPRKQAVYSNKGANMRKRAPCKSRLLALNVWSRNIQILPRRGISARLFAFYWTTWTAHWQMSKKHCHWSLAILAP